MAIRIAKTINFSMWPCLEVLEGSGLWGLVKISLN
jgi:hypothetical protein